MKLKLEALNYVAKIDIAEEIERMTFHLSQLKKILLRRYQMAKNRFYYLRNVARN